MNLYQWLCVLGVPSLISLLWGRVVQAQFRQLQAVRSGVQALLRDRLLQGYHYYERRGWADYDDRANLENLYLQYHALGANGIMDHMRSQFLALPLRNPEARNEPDQR